MGRLIEVQSLEGLPSEFRVQAGDLLVFKATGGRVRSRTNIVQALGAFSPGTMSPEGQVLAAMGGPDSVVFLARGEGQAEIEVIAGDPWVGPRSPAVLRIIVEP